MKKKKVTAVSPSGVRLPFDCAMIKLVNHKMHKPTIQFGILALLLLSVCLQHANSAAPTFVFRGNMWHRTCTVKGNKLANDASLCC